VLSGAARFLVEFIRRNPKVLWGLSNAQLAAAGSVVAGAMLIAWVTARQVAGPEKAAGTAAKAAVKAA
jgi:phosphatidylglycerol:prolipoprotein diacylglycerol transferase